MKNSVDKQVKAYFIRPTSEFHFENMPIYLSAAYNEDEAWSYVLEHNAIEKEEYYIAYVFILKQKVTLGLLYNPHEQPTS